MPFFADEVRRVLSSPFFGKATVTYGYKGVLIPANLCLVLGTIFYTYSTSWWMVIFAQVVMGVGSGTLGVTRGFIADNSPPERRTYLLAYLTLVKTLQGVSFT